MNYLFRYLQLLSPEQRAALLELPLSEREHQVLAALIQAGVDDSISKAELLAGLGISSSHFDKLCSVLLDKVYAAIVPEGGTALLYDLNRRSLFGHFCHQMKKQEKALIAEHTQPAELAEFYSICFSLLHRITRKDYDEKLMRDIGEKYLAAKANTTPGDRLFVESGIMNALIQDTAARGAQNRLGDDIEQRLNALKPADEELAERDNVLGLFQYYRVWVLFYTLIDSRPDIRLSYLRLSAGLCERHPDVLPEEDRALTFCRIAEAHYNDSDFAGAGEQYRQIFDVYHNVTSRDYYHTTKYIQVLIILGQYSDAARLIDERFGVFMENREPALSTMASLSYAKLYLCSGRIAQAKHFIDLGFELIAKNVYIQYEIELRLLETAYFYLSGDEEFAETLAGKHTKYLQSKGFVLKNSRFYPWFPLLVQSFLAEKTGVKRLSKKLEAKLREFHTGPAKIYGLLLEAMRSCGARGDAPARSVAHYPESSHVF